MVAGPTDSPIAAARARADAELEKALSVLDPNDFSSNVPAFRAFTDRVKRLFIDEAAELLRTSTDFPRFKRDLHGLREQIVDEYTKAPPRRKMTKREWRRLERPMPIDKMLSVAPIDKWDLFAPTSLLPNKKYGVRRELERVLGEQLPYWLREAARRFGRRRPASDESPGTAKTPDRPPMRKSTEAPASAPEGRLSRFMQEHPGTTYADVKYTARVHTSDFQDWRRGKLKQTSVMSRRVEEVLDGTTPLKKKPPKPPED